MLTGDTNRSTQFSGVVQRPTWAPETGYISSFLLAISAFLIPWGEGLRDGLPFDVSKVFLVVAMLLAARAAIAARMDQLPYNRALRYWLVYTFLHTIIVYGFWKPDQLQWGILGTRDLADGAVKIDEGNALRALRFFLFALYGGAVSVYAKNERTRAVTFLAFAAGVNGVMALGGYQLQADPTTAARLAGGSLDPNAFGLSCAIAIISSMYLLTTHPMSRVIRLAAILLAPAPIIGLIASGSRGALFGTLAGVSAIILLDRVRNQRRVYVLLGALLGLTLLFAVPAQIKESARDRLSLSSIIQDRGSSRPDLWRSYLAQLPDYAITGTGMHLAPTVLNESWDAPRMTHNIFLQLMVENGALGLVLFILGVSAAFKPLIGVRTIPQPALAGLLATWLIASFFVDSFGSRESWLALGLACSHIKA